MSMTTQTAAPPAAWSLPNDPQLIQALTDATSARETTDLLDLHNLGPAEYHRGRLSVLHIGEGLDNRIVWLCQRVIERTTGRSLTHAQLTDLHSQTWRSLGTLKRHLERQAEQVELFAGSRRVQLGTARFVGEQPIPPLAGPNPEVNTAAFDAYGWELREHELRVALASEQWS